MDFTRKKITKRSLSADVNRQIRWWQNPPFGAIGIAGCFGVPTWLMIDSDECGLSIGQCNPKYGHAKRGIRAFRRMPVCI